MHSEESHCCFVDGVLAEFFWVLLVMLENDISKRPILHILKKDPNAIVVVIDINALDYLIAVEKRDQTWLIDDQLFLSWCRTLHALECADFLVLFALNFENLTLTALSYPCDDLIVFFWVFILDLDSLSDVARNLLMRSKAFNLLSLLVKHHLKTNIWMLRLRVKIELLQVIDSSSGKALPVNCLILFFDLKGHYEILWAILLV